MRYILKDILLIETDTMYEITISNLLKTIHFNYVCILEAMDTVFKLKTSLVYSSSLRN